MLRAHEFDKVELMAYATPEQAPGLLDEMVARAERAISLLELPYRVIEICAGEMGQSDHRSFDVEVYAPGADAWLEASSISWLGDYQARRAGIRFRRHDDEGRPLKGTEFIHTLNGSARAVPRVWAAIIENCRNADGSISVPLLLRPYMRGIDRIVAADTASRSPS
jgi:seryl-tRNA synthetase